MSSIIKESAAVWNQKRSNNKKKTAKAESTGVSGLVGNMKVR